MQDRIFTTDYYKRVITDFGYDQSLFDGFTNNFSQFTTDDLQKTFLCHSGLYNFEASLKPKIVTSGFGLSGVPHLGTLSQLYRLSLLGNADYTIQIVLGDLDAYNGKNVSLARTQDLARIYEAFITSTLLFEMKRTIIRNQYDALDALRTSYLIGRSLDDIDFLNTEEDLHDFYASNGKVDKDMSYRRKLSLNLMLADFISVGQTYPEVLVLLGIDEHKYVRLGQKVSKKLKQSENGLKPVSIHSLYTPIIKGLNGYPKMSKSFPESGISLDMDIATVRACIMQHERVNLRHPREDVIYQIVCSIGLNDDISLSDIETAYDNESQWQDIKEALVLRINHFAQLWQEASYANGQ